MSALIGALRVSLSADTAKFQVGMKQAERQAKATQSSIGKSMGLMKAGIAGFVSAFSVGMLTSGIKNALEYAGSLGEIAQQLGVTTTQLQTFRYQVQQNGGSLEDADKSLGKFSLSISKALSGSVQSAKAFQAVGVSLDDLRNKSKTDIMGGIADGMKATGGASANAAAGVAIFGKGFQKIIPTLDQGSAGMNAAALAAQDLGIVLSDDLINQADEAADKVDKLWTVLRAQIAGAVANNAGAIANFVQGLVDLIAKLQAAAQWMDNFRARFNAAAYALAGMDDMAARARGSAYVSGVNPTIPGKSVTIKLAPAKSPGMPKLEGSPNQFLAPKGGGAKKDKKGPADTSLRDAHQFDQELRRANMDILRAQQDLAVNFDDRNTIAVQILDAERAAYAAELEYEVKAKEKTAAQAAQLLTLYDQRDSLERQKILADEAAQAAEESARYQDKVMDLDMEVLESRARLATTASEQREIELEILDLAYRRRKAALDAAIAQEKDAAILQRLNLERDRLGETYANDRQDVINSTRNPIEEWAASVPKSAAEITEALQGIQVNALDGLSDGISDIITGTKSMKEAFGDMAQSIIADLIKMSVRMLIFRALSGIMGGAMGGGGFMPGAADSLPGWGSTGDLSTIPPFASGGRFSILGRGGTDRNIMSIGGLPVARVSRGEMVDIHRDSVNDNGGNAPVNVYQTYKFAGVAITEQQFVSGLMQTKVATISAIKDMNRRR